MSTDPITLKVSGALLVPDAVDTLARILHAVPDRTGVALVHGGGPQLDEALGKLDEPIRHHDGLRVTSRCQAGVVQATLDGLGADLTSRLQAHGIPAVHVDSLQARLLAATKASKGGPELGRVGTPHSFRAQGLDPVDTVPVVTPVGTDGTGPLNVNADEAAAAIACELDSQALVFATGVPGVLDAHGALLEHLSLHEAERLVQHGTAAGGMQPKLAAARQALEGGVATVHVAGLTEHTLARALDDEAPGPGTRITEHREVPA